MFNLKPIFRLLLLTLAAYTLIMILATVSGFDQPYAKGFASAGEKLLGRIGENGTVWFKAKEKEADKSAEVLLTLLNQNQIDEVTEAARRQGGGKNVKVKSAQYKIETWVYGFLPTALVIALILASPISILRKLLALLLGLFVFGLFLWFKTYIELLYLYNLESSSFLNALQLSPFWLGTVERLHGVFFSISFNMIMATFVWALVSLRKDDIPKLWPQAGGEAKAKNESADK